MLTPTLETDRLIIRRYKESDIDALYEIITDKRLSKFITFPETTYEEELDYIKTCIIISDTSNRERWAIELKETNDVVGMIEITHIFKQHNYCDVGYTIRYKYWGNGYAAEALKIVSDYFLNERKFHLVECSCNELNIQSSRVMIKAGFKKDGYVPDRRLNEDGTYSGVEYYSKRK